MKCILLIVTLFLFVPVINAQYANDFVGAIKLNDTSVITYRIKFNINAGHIKGFSLTDFNGEHETKSTITGFYDSDKKLISFNETGIIYTKSPVSQNDFCNIYFQPAKFNLDNPKSIDGPFYGKFDDGTKCIDGEILLNSAERVEKRIEKFSKKVNKSKRLPDSLKAKFNAIKILDSTHTNILRTNEITSVFTKSKKIRFFIYDGGQVDNDIITVYKDGKIILYKHAITDKKELLEVDITNSKTRLTILAESVGSIGTNTVVVEIIDDNNNIKTMTSLDIGEKTEIDILKK